MPRSRNCLNPYLGASYSRVHRLLLLHGEASNLARCGYFGPIMGIHVSYSPPHYNS